MGEGPWRCHSHARLCVTKPRRSWPLVNAESCGYLGPREGGLERTKLMTQQQLATFLLSALLASTSLLVSTFGTLYSAYARIIVEGSPVSTTLRRVCYLLALTIVVASITAIRIVVVLSADADAIVSHLHYFLYAIVALFNAAPLILSWRMFSDARA